MASGLCTLNIRSNLIKCLLLLAFAAVSFNALPQQQDAATLQETAKTFLKQGDYSNAILVLNRALQQEPGNMEIQRELAFAHYLQREFARSLEILKPMLEKRDADIQVYQLAGLVYKAQNDDKEAEKLYNKGVRKFPSSGVLYNEYGELLWYRQDYNAIRQWEKGIEVDPNYSGNYYNAAKHYFFTTDKVWSIIYGEIFVNMESYSRRSIEIKNILLNSYKKLFADTDLLKGQNTKNEFTAAFLNTANRQSSIVSSGITPESLTMIRTRFVLDWDDKYASRLPYRLFEYHRQLLKEGLFDAYNQWLFGPVQNLTAYQNWTNSHAEVYKDFTNFHKGRIFKMPSGQNYQNR
jgi:tetratricopeptide (TPR) repeat protein